MLKLEWRKKHSTENKRESDERTLEIRKSEREPKGRPHTLWIDEVQRDVESRDEAGGG
jgi:hypothetical protein